VERIAAGSGRGTEDLDQLGEQVRPRGVGNVTLREGVGVVPIIGKFKPADFCSDDGIETGQPLVCFIETSFQNAGPNEILFFLFYGAVYLVSLRAQNCPSPTHDTAVLRQYLSIPFFSWIMAR